MKVPCPRRAVWIGVFFLSGAVDGPTGRVQPRSGDEHGCRAPGADAKDADAIGEQVLEQSVQAATLADGAPDPEALWDQLRKVYDPEIPVNIVDLGLVYGVQLDDQANATIDMTLTSPTCPLTDKIEYDTKYVLDGLVNSVTINWVWLPPWTLEMISEDGREQLRALGFTV